MLQKQSEMPFSMEEFLTLCRYHMNRRDSAVVEAAVTGGEAETSLTVLRRLREYRKAVSEELASLRARRLGRDQAAYADRSLWVADAEAAAKAAYGASDPLETVEMLFMQEWRLLDELESQHYFDLEMRPYLLKRPGNGWAPELIRQVPARAGGQTHAA